MGLALDLAFIQWTRLLLRTIPLQYHIIICCAIFEKFDRKGLSWCVPEIFLWYYYCFWPISLSIFFFLIHRGCQLKVLSVYLLFPCSMFSMISTWKLPPRLQWCTILMKPIVWIYNTLRIIISKILLLVLISIITVQSSSSVKFLSAY